MSESALDGSEFRLGRRGIAIRQKMAEIVRDAATRLPPFDRLGRESSFSPYLYLVEGYAPEARKAAQDAFVRFLEFVVSDHVCKDEEAMRAWDKIDAEYQRRYAERYVPLHLPNNSLSIKESKQIIRSVCARELPGFTHRGSKSGIVSFARDMRGVDSFSVDFDLGSLGPGNFNVHLSTDGPAYSVELTTLLSIRDRSWRYSTAEGCSAAVSDVCALTRLLIPVLERKFVELGGPE